MTSIGAGAFYGCSGLTSVTIPNSVTSIGEKAFSGCNVLTDVMSYLSVPLILSYNPFPDQLKTSGTLYVLEGTRQAYVEKGWGMYFANIKEIEAEPIWLTISDVETGSMFLHCERGKEYTFRFAAAAGWEIHSITFAGKDVTESLTTNGEFTTPAMSESTELRVAYEKAGTAVADVLKKSPMKVLAFDDQVVVRGLDKGTPIHVYDLNGRLLTTAVAGNNETRIRVNAESSQAVVVKAGEHSVKVMVK